MKISVVMSVYNGSKFLKPAIESILKQTYKNFEFIIVNDGSTDNSLDVINSFDDNRIIIVNQKNQGLSKSLNNGIAISKGDYIARMDADDISLPDRFEKQVSFLLNNKDYIIVGGNANCTDIKGNFLFQTRLPLTDKEIREKLPESPFFHSATIFKKSAFLKSGKYPDEIFQYFEDKILWNKMASHGRMANLSDLVLNYRMVHDSISNLPYAKVVELRTLSNKIIKNNYNITSEDTKRINEIVSIKKNNKYANYYLRLGAFYLGENRRLLALKNLLISFCFNPFERNTSTRIVACFLPFHIYENIKNRKTNSSQISK